MTDQSNNEKEMKQELAEERLDRIDILFAAVGPFISALFCIMQYFLDETMYFKIIAAGLYFLILITTYYLAVSNNQKKYENFWKHIRKYAKAAGLLNPFVLAFGILLAIVKDLWALVMCVIFVVAQIMMYITAGSKYTSKRIGRI